MKLYEYNITRTVLEDFEPVQITSPGSSVRYLRDNVYDKDEMWREKCFAVFLDNDNKILGHILIGVGGTESVTMDKKIIAKGALDVFASSVILTHNHPSGNPHPGKTDIKMTEEIRDALKLFNICLLDHIIMTEKQYYSFSEETTYKI